VLPYILAAVRGKVHNVFVCSVSREAVLGRLVAGFDPEPVHVGFMVNKVPLVHRQNENR